ncbi:MAG: hypothetical protein ACO31E_10705 [Phycisphaerales bacterium]|jgi:hypothetical protein
MEHLTIVIVSSAGEIATQVVDRQLPLVQSHLERSGGILGRRFDLELWSDRNWEQEQLPDKRGWRSPEGSRALAERIRARPDVAAVIMWGGDWLSATASANIGVFLEETKDLPIVVVSGTCLENHANHPGSFSIIPRERSRIPILQSLISRLPPDAVVAWIGREGESPDEAEAVRAACAARGLTHWEHQLPPDFPIDQSTEDHFHAILSDIESLATPTHWFAGLFSLNFPLVQHVSTLESFKEFIALNTGRVPDWQTARDSLRRISFLADNAREHPDLELTRRLGLDLRFPRAPLDSLLMLQLGARRASSLPTTATREQIFDAWVAGLKSIDGSQAVFVGTRRVVWFNPDTRRRANGCILLVERLGDELRRHPIQIARDAHGNTIPVPVVYLYVDLLAIERISIEDQAADLDFYLDLRCMEPLPLDQIRFANADPNSLSIEAVVDHQVSEPEGLMHVKRFKIRGRFGFAAALDCFPFDCQVVHIDLCPANPGSNPLHLQGPPRSTLDSDFDVPGWSIIAADHSEHTHFWHSPKSIRYRMHYQAYRGLEFQWLLRRKSKDTILFVAVPMSVLLGVSYFAALSSLEDAETKVSDLAAMMLATIALYFATSKPRSDDLTILDRAFRVAYLCIGGLLGTILIAEHVLADWYSIVVRLWLILMPALMIREALRCVKLVRMQAESFRGASSGGD